MTEYIWDDLEENCLGKVVVFLCQNVFSNRCGYTVERSWSYSVSEWMSKPLSCVFLEQDQITEDEGCHALIVQGHGQHLGGGRWN